ncbi:hypothetical protein A2886_00200 [candidate division WWE3 bacterium RIFCSPHIGHO2_01_FULL_42_13]|uniref:Uncharacterized protein n=1 Tax=candidate division WWE3 bacterium RIFCSPHIGHO2_01_FULL_42_13 TaxID=1802617 RepID=A0A1F4US63_UNCKA|nr:MAG: hypothetical protein A2886_00200 [candidate division WWE3 bacterium RIFCSPHIGHO2_01_FULL_42_13]
MFMRSTFYLKYRIGVVVFFIIFMTNYFWVDFGPSIINLNNWRPLYLGMTVLNVLWMVPLLTLTLFGLLKKARASVGKIGNKNTTPIKTKQMLAMLFTLIVFIWGIALFPYMSPVFLYKDLRDGVRTYTGVCELGTYPRYGPTWHFIKFTDEGRSLSLRISRDRLYYLAGGNRFKLRGTLLLPQYYDGPCENIASVQYLAGSEFVVAAEIQLDLINQTL